MGREYLELKDLAAVAVSPLPSLSEETAAAPSCPLYVWVRVEAKTSGTGQDGHSGLLLAFREWHAKGDPRQA